MPLKKETKPIKHRSNAELQKIEITTSWEMESTIRVQIRGEAVCALL